MASRPMLRKLAADIEEMGGEDWIMDQIASGVAVGKIAAGFNVSRRMLYFWRDMKAHKERRAALWAEAMRLSAEAKAEDAEAVIEAVQGRESTPAQVSAAAKLSDIKRWQAGVRDKETYGQATQQGGVVVNIGSMHLDALLKHGRAALPAPEPELLEAEVIDRCE